MQMFIIPTKDTNSMLLIFRDFLSKVHVLTVFSVGLSVVPDDEYLLGLLVTSLELQGVLGSSCFLDNICFLETLFVGV